MYNCYLILASLISSLWSLFYYFFILRNLTINKEVGYTYFSLDFEIQSLNMDLRQFCWKNLDVLIKHMIVIFFHKNLQENDILFICDTRPTCKQKDISNRM